LTDHELMTWGYLASIRKAPDTGGRALAHYTVIKPTKEQLLAAIAAHVMAQRTIDGSDPEKWMKTVRTACGWAKNDRKSNATRPAKSTGVF